MPQYPAVISLSSLDGSNGFKIDGGMAGDYAGTSVAGAGDVNGDGFPDLIVGAPWAGYYAGYSYIVFGKASSFPSPLQLSSLSGSDGFEISRFGGYGGGDILGFSVAAAGDINGDGFSDFIVGAPNADPNGQASGVSYVVFGTASGFPANFNVCALDGSNGFQINGQGALDLAGSSVSPAGDINGDGFADLIIGAPAPSPGTGFGAAYVVFGKASGFGPGLELSSLNGTNGFKISAEGSNDDFGFRVAAAGDVNGDGLSDLIISAYAHSSGGLYDNGAAYVVFGKADGFGANFDLSSLNGSNGFKIYGLGNLSSLGFSVSSAGDVNGDGLADIIVSAQPHTASSYSAGVSYVIFGKTSGFGATLDLSSLDGSNGFTISGEAPGDYSGWAVSSAGDVNGDGFADILIGAPGASPDGATRSGATYVVFGKASGFPANLDLSSLDGSNGFKIDGEAPGDYSGWAVSSAGDVNGDGVADVIIGAPRADPNGTSSGAAYVVFGHKSDSVSPPPSPTRGDFNGDGKADILLQNDSGQPAIWLMNGSALSRGGPVGFNPGPVWQTKASGDFDGDGKADILWQNADGSVAIWFMNGTNVAGGALVPLDPGPSWQIVGSGDFNGDGIADILWQNADGTPAIWLMNGTTISSAAAFMDPGTSWHVICSGDFNGDGKSDILWQNVDGTPAIWLMNGTSVVSGTALFNPGTAWHLRAAGDFNGDGNSDLLWQNDDGTAAIWFMNGTSFLSGGIVSADPGSSWHVVGVGDFNGDGKADILWQNADGTPAVWLMNGTSVLSWTTLTNPGPSWHAIAMGS